MEKIRVYCKNTAKFYEIKPGTPLISLMEEIGINALAAHVDNQLKELGHKMDTFRCSVCRDVCTDCTHTNRTVECSRTNCDESDRAISVA
ncbi:MAG: hypothetical protein IKW15_07095, partial [Bacteroidales bacterium]|nr:hypothetical protein [Bacteroidales bacterium]